MILATFFFFFPTFPPSLSLSLGTTVIPRAQLPKRRQDNTQTSPKFTSTLVSGQEGSDSLFLAEADFDMSSRVFFPILYAEIEVHLQAPMMAVDLRELQFFFPPREISIANNFLPVDLIHWKRGKKKKKLKK